MGNKKVFFFVLGLVALVFPISSQAKYGFYPTKFSLQRQRSAAVFGDLATAVGDKVLYYGGPVISNAKVWVVFWGSQVDSTTQSQIAGFYATVANSTYMDWLNEYKTYAVAQDGKQGTQQYIGRGQFEKNITIEPSNTNTTIDDVAIQAEMQSQINSGHLPKPDDNTLFMIYFPPAMKITVDGSTSCKDYCAYHGFAGTPATAHFYYGVMPDISSGSCYFSCGSGDSEFDSLTSISSHEMIEAITDPFPTPGSSPAYPQAWNDSQGNEVADLCVGKPDGTLTGNGVTYKVQSIWNNNANVCTTANWASP